MDSPNVEQVVPFLWVSNIEKSVGYYVDGLGFEIINQWIDDGKLAWCWLRLGGAALMLQEFRKDRRPEGTLGNGVSITFQCKDALAIYREARARGLHPSRPVVGNGMWVTILSDPDGYKLDFESKTDVPEETELTDEGPRQLEDTPRLTSQPS